MDVAAARDNMVSCTGPVGGVWLGRALVKGLVVMGTWEAAVLLPGLGCVARWRGQMAHALAL